MKQLIEALGLNEQEQDYLFHLVGNLAAFGFKTKDGKEWAMNEREYQDRLELIRTEERINDWNSRGVTYRNQAEILAQYERYLEGQRKGMTLSQYFSLPDIKRDLDVVRPAIFADRANWEDLAEISLSDVEY